LRLMLQGRRKIRLQLVRRGRAASIPPDEKI
jgi:hypothetical protein